MIFAFAAGLLSTVNPCGFAMLPAYLSFFMGLDEGAGSSRAVIVSRALKIGLIMSGGFVAVFGTAGLLIRFGGSAIENLVADGLAWVALAAGAGVVGLGVWLLLGNSLTVRVPTFRTTTRSQGAGTLFTFGVSYALASLSCAFPIFAGVVAASFGQSLLDGVGSFLAYAAGMAAIVMVLTVGLALGKEQVVSRLRRASHGFNRAAGVVLILAGAFIVFYWTLILAGGDNALATNSLTTWVEGLQSDLTDLIGAVPLWAWLPALGTPIIAAVVFALRPTREGQSNRTV
ncbi:MAG: cytochrome c biogenesis protein CcdA [Acidimicrobiia bacterium]|nr:cytochrome c biogenesis protein CcdA [Acidimicrobiia bacterium]MBT8216085.1 cytochrome c biogenesis protein CcdA [Acidimicrobiia bacterium]NNF08858.1 cytochrome c biogenesis protein CcdA [Acidimicrobiia bacterium]NNL70959.1 cytochrome c biogenesis protein CcdA [Acidimicrobiia bacterium]